MVVNSFDRCKALFIFITVIFILQSALAAPKSTKNYEISEGGLIDIADDAYVEGSLRTGGKQPDYKIDLKSKLMQKLLSEARIIGHETIDFWKKIERIVQLVKSEFKYTSYNGRNYRSLMKSYRDKKQDVPLSKYLACNGGVCREHALVLHFALKAAGISNKHAYATIFRASPIGLWKITEDHAFVVVKFNNIDWIIDAYYTGFNGYRLDQLISKYGSLQELERSPIAVDRNELRKISHINNYPKIYNPRRTNPFCSKIF